MARPKSTINRNHDAKYADILATLAKQYPDKPTESIPDDIIQWAERDRTLKGKPFSWAGHEYLIDICRDVLKTKSVFLAKGRQLGASEAAVTAMLYFAIKHPGVVCLYMSSNAEKAKLFSKIRIKNWAISTSPKIAKLFPKDEDLVGSRQLSNGSILLFRSSQGNFESTRSIPADLLILDEAQSMPMDALSVATESMSASKFGHLLCIGTGAPQGSSWHEAWQTGTEYHYHHKSKKWRRVAGQKNNKHAHSYFLPQSATGRFTAKEIKQKLEDTPGSYTRAQEEIEAMWTAGTERPFPYDVMQRCLVSNTIRANNEPQFLGIDWGGNTKSKTVLTVLHFEPNTDTFVIDDVYDVNTSKVDIQTQRVIEYIERMNPAGIVCDLGGNTAAVQRLESKYDRRIVKAWFSGNIADPFVFKADRNQIHIDKSTAVDDLIQITGQRRLQIPKKHSWVIDHFTCIDGSLQTNRSGQAYMQYTTDKKRNRDDAAMSLLYAHAAYKLKGKSVKHVCYIA